MGRPKLEGTGTDVSRDGTLGGRILVESYSSGESEGPEAQAKAKAIA